MQKELYRELCERIDWQRPELSATDFADAYRRGEMGEAALGFVRHMRSRPAPRLGYSAEDIEAARASASDEERQAAAKKLEDSLGPEGFDRPHGHALVKADARSLFIAGTREHFEECAVQLAAQRPEERDGTWGTTHGLCRRLQRIWRLDVCPDELVAHYLVWLTRQSRSEWDWARTWGETMLGTRGHNWWVHTFGGFWKAGVFFPELRGFGRFASLVPQWLEYELKLVLEPDGFSIERSGYHYGTVEMFVEQAGIAELNGIEFSAAFKERLAAGKRVRDIVVAPDGGLPHFGDGFAGHRAPEQAEGPVRENDGEPADTCLPDSGYYFIRQDWSRRADWACIDAGAKGAIADSHDHTDVFGFTMYSRGRPILVDNGAGPYGDTPERTWRVGSASHNTATVDGRDHIPMRSEWRWDAVVMPTVEEWISRPEFAYFSGVHEAYCRLERRVTGARRKLFYLRGQYWILIDRFTAEEEDAAHVYEQHFHPGAATVLEADGRAVTGGPGGNLAIVPVPGATGEATVSPNPHPIDGYDNPDHLCYRRETTGHGLMVVVLVPFEGDDAPDVRAELLPVECDERTLSAWEATAVKITLEGREDVYFDQHMHWNLPWRVGGRGGSGRLYHSAVGEE